jgi:GTPase SAR1 family protein
MHDVIQEVNQFLSKSVDPIQKRLLFQGRPSEAALKDTPMILMLGNHSSGKSSFINHFVAEEIQQTGMAPTDEDFTIIRYGQVAKERPGNSLVSNPELGYEGLNQFGPRFLSHLKMKTVCNDRLTKVSLVDTPGMIDSADSQAHRGFDFQGVVRWFAERADLIMLFFDPERPGTTAETLQIYTESLRDFDHKLLVVMNKVDQFRKLSDFARCYGTLCWNLGKVMRTKDLPQIYVTYLPVQHASTSVLPMDEFERSRLQLIYKMEQTAFQRADNILTDVTIYLDRLLLHTQILNQAKKWRSALKIKTYFFALICAFIGCGGIWLQAEWSENLKYAGMGGSILTFLIFAGLLVSFKTKQRQNWSLNNPLEVFEGFATLHHVRNDRYENLKAHWHLIGSQTIRAMQDLGIDGLPKVKKKEIQAIIDWLEKKLPELRRHVHLNEDAQVTDIQVPDVQTLDVQTPDVQTPDVQASDVQVLDSSTNTES